jgi:hypothetical protein
MSEAGLCHREFPSRAHVSLPLLCACRLCVTAPVLLFAALLQRRHIGDKFGISEIAGCYVGTDQIARL